MPSPIGNLGSYLLGGYDHSSVVKEDLADYIQNIDPHDAPLTSVIGRTKATGTLHEWLIDVLPSRATRGVIEGKDWEAPTQVKPTRPNNRTEIFLRDVGVTGTILEVDTAGFSDYYLYEVEKATKAIMRDIEIALMDDGADATGTSTTGRVMKSLEEFIETNILDPTELGVPAADTSHAAYFLLEDIDDSLQSAWEQGGQTDLIVMDAAYKRRLNMLLTSTSPNGNFQRNIAAVEKKVVVSVDVYDCDFGLVPVQLNRWSPTSANTSTSTATQTDVSGRIWFLQRSMVRLAWLRPVKHQMMGMRGDSIAGQVVGELTLEVGNEKALAVIKGANQFPRST